MKEELFEIHEYMEAKIRGIHQILDGIKDLEIEEKTSYRDLLTKADKGVEAYLRKAIKSRFSHHEVLGEESYEKGKTYDYENLWVIDPIDGTTNFVKQGHDFCTILSYFKDNEAVISYVFDVKKDHLYWAIKGWGVYKDKEKLPVPKRVSLKESLVSVDVRRTEKNHPDLFKYLIKNAFSIRVIGSGGLDGIRVITGRLGAYFHVKGGPWDFSPFFLMAKEQGLAFTDFEGRIPSNTEYSSFILASPPIHEEIMRKWKQGFVESECPDGKTEENCR